MKMKKNQEKKSINSFLCESLEQRDSKYPIMVSQRGILVYAMLSLFVSFLFEFELFVYVHACEHLCVHMCSEIFKARAVDVLKSYTW